MRDHQNILDAFKSLVEILGFLRLSTYSCLDPPTKNILRLYVTLLARHKDAGAISSH